MFYKTDRLDRPSYPTRIMLLLTELDEPEVYRLVGYPRAHLRRHVKEKTQVEQG